MRETAGSAAAPAIRCRKFRRGSFILEPPFRSFDHLVGAGQQRRWHFETKRLCGDKIDDEIEFGWLLHRDVARFRPMQNLVDKVGRAPEQVGNICSIGHQASSFDALPITVHRWYAHSQCQCVDTNPVGVYERVGTDIKCIRTALERVEGGRDILNSPDFRYGDLKAQRAGRCLNLAYLQHNSGIVDLPHNPQPAKTGNNLAQEFESLATSIRYQLRQTGDVAARSRQAGDKAGAHRVPRPDKHDRH